MSSRHARIEIRPAEWTGYTTTPESKREHYLRLVASNGQVLATSETYANRQNARRAVKAWREAFAQALSDPDRKTFAERSTSRLSECPPEVKAAVSAIAKRLQWPSIHWGAEDLHPDALPHIAAAALDSLDANGDPR